MTDQQQPRPPLWRVMQSVYYDAFSLYKSEHKCRAAEISAMADAIPEEFYGANGVKAWLRNEIKRAEEGE